MTEPVLRQPEKFSRFQEVIDRLMAKKPEDRYQSAIETVKVIEALKG